MSTDEEVRSLVCELCRQFYEHGWVTGTGGSISIRSGEKIFMTPSGVQKERIKPEELFIVDKSGKVLTPPATKPGCGPAKLSDCAPLFLHAYNQRDAGAVLHSHGLSCNLVTLLFEGQSEFRISKQEMIKGIDGHGYFDDLVIPIIENTAWEHELADSLGQAIANYPKAVAVLVRHHGMYVWGKTWEQAKRHAECLHYLFESTIQSYKLGVTHLITSSNNGNTTNNKKRLHSEANSNSGNQRKCAKNGNKLSGVNHLLFDIEGTLSPITFVKDVLFPYSSKHVKDFLTAKAASCETIQSLLKEFVEIAHSHFEYSTQYGSLKADDLSTMTTFIQQLIKDDRKVTPLKVLQGMIWKSGYEKKELISTVFEDVPSNLVRFSQELDMKMSIYSSGSRKAQHLLFQYTSAGNLMSYFQSFFDTKNAGPKTSKESYEEIALTLGAEKNSDILFVTDILAEAKAAKEAGFSVVLSIRPGNAEITEMHEFDTITSLDQLFV
jgi:methylthioribulose 1-phosphate dehydratase/enolase-phosphatase E1